MLSTFSPLRLSSLHVTRSARLVSTSVPRLMKGSAIVTGTGQGIGRSIALRLAQDGFNVCVNDISANASNVNKVVSEIQELYPNVKALPGLADVAKRQEVDSLIENTVSELGELSVMISNAGVISIHPLLDAPESELDRLISVNVKGLLNCGISAAKQFIAQNLNKVASGNTDPSGKIINAASISSYRAADYHGHYSMTKAAARSLTQTLAIELAPHQITVNAYAPGIVATPMWSEIDDTIGRINGVEKGETLKRVAATSLLGRPSVPQDVAGVVSFLAGPDSDFMTGQTVIVDGGIVFG